MSARVPRSPDQADRGEVGSRAVGFVALTVALLTAVAVASASLDIRGVPSGSGSAGSSAGALSAGTSEYLLLLGIAGAAGVIVLLAFAFLGASWSSRAGGRLAGGGVRVPRWLVAILLVVVAAFPIAVVALARGAAEEHETVRGGRQPAHGVPLPRPGETAASPSGWSWAPVIAAVGVAVGATAVAVGLRTRGRRIGTPASRVRRRSAAAVSLERTIADLQNDPDPRHAVISAYAWMEDELTESGWGRRPSRAPFEYLDEALRELAVPPEPAHVLTELFEVARFSSHRVDPAMRDRAIGALVEIRGSLREEPSI